MVNLRSKLVKSVLLSLNALIGCRFRWEVINTADWQIENIANWKRIASNCPPTRSLKALRDSSRIAAGRWVGRVEFLLLIAASRLWLTSDHTSVSEGTVWSNGEQLLNNAFVEPPNRAEPSRAEPSSATPSGRKTLRRERRVPTALAGSLYNGGN